MPERRERTIITPMDRLVHSIFGGPRTKDLPEGTLEVLVGGKMTKTPSLEVDKHEDLEFQDSLRKALEDKMRHLSDIEREILRLRLDGQGRTMREIGKLISRSPSTVRRIEARAIAKLRIVPNIVQFDDYQK